MSNQKEERAFKGVWIPKHIWLNDELSPIEKLFLAEIESLDNDPKKGCFASNEYFGNFFKISEGRAANIISGLRKRGYIKQVFFDGKVRGMRLHENVKAGFTLDGTRLHENVKAGFTKRGKQVSRKREHTNIVDNKVDNKEEERGAALPLFSSCENSETLDAEKKEKGFQNGAALLPPFTPTGETIEPKPATVVRLYENDLSGVTAVEPSPSPEYQTNPRETQPAEFRRVNIGEEIERLKTDPAAKETFALVRKIPSKLFDEYVEAFGLEIKGTGETYKDVPALKKHFLNWSGTRFEIAQRQKTQFNGKRSSLTRAGGDLSKYQEKQIF